jgi:hypothetical protein
MAAGTTTADIAAQHAVGLSILPTKIGAESGIRQLTLDTDTSTDNNTRVGRQESATGCRLVRNHGSPALPTASL